jgi:hypothetical protein
VGKQRNGPTGTVRLAFLKQYTRFENLASGAPYQLPPGQGRALPPGPEDLDL